jgi:hypothetical protein
MVELFPYAERSRGISIEQFFVRGAGFFTTFINPIGMDGAGWKYLIMYIAMICLEILTIYFFYPETQGRTLEELAFCKYFWDGWDENANALVVFEDDALAEKAVVAVEKTIHHESVDDKAVGERGVEVGHVEETLPAKA